MKQVTDGVYQLSIPIPKDTFGGIVTRTLAHLVKDTDGWAVVDPGFGSDDAWQEFWGQASSVVKSPQDLRLILLTHNHIDHAGLTMRIKEASGAEVVLHQHDLPSAFRKRMPPPDTDPFTLTKEWLAKGGMPEEDFEGFRSFRGSASGSVPQIDVDAVLEGEVAKVPGSDSFYAYWTPGHTLGHVCFHDPHRKLLFVGDYISQAASPMITLSPWTGEHLLQEYLDSLLRVRDLDVTTVLHAHGREFQNLSLRVDEVRGEYDKRFKAIGDVIGKGQLTVFEVWKKMKPSPASGDEMPARMRNQTFFATLACLKLLTRRGELEERERDGILYYSVSSPRHQQPH